MTQTTRQTLKERYAVHKQRCEVLIEKIEQHDQKLAESARQILGIVKNKK